MQALTEIQRIMHEDACTKDVFREMDGFLVLMNVLSTVQPQVSSHKWSEDELLNATRLVFILLSETMHEHPQNADFFEVRQREFGRCL